MNLPFLDNILIEDRKLSDYLLSINHPDGNRKAKFFIALGFDEESLRIALIAQAKEKEVMEIKKSEFGTKYVIESEIITPNKQSITLRSVWIVYLKEKFVKLVTAYPVKIK